MNPRIQKLEEKIKAMQAQKQALLARDAVKERKQRTRNLIQIGAIVEKYLHLTTPEEAESFCRSFIKGDVKP